MVNPYTYKQFIITEEPLNDKDPNAADTYGGTDFTKSIWTINFLFLFNWFMVFFIINGCLIQKL
jgi:hypothetical protein